MGNQPQTLVSHQSSEPSTDDDNELEKLEADVNQMAQKLLEYRTTLPDQLNSTLSSILAAQRPVIVTHLDDGSDPGPSGDPNHDAGRLVESVSGAISLEENQESAEKVQLLKHKISGNASAMPIVLKRMKECISRLDKLESCNGIIHPPFKRKRIS